LPTADVRRAVEHSEIWGEATTACASDSKKFGAWDQNLLTERTLNYNELRWGLNSTVLATRSFSTWTYSASANGSISNVMDIAFPLF
jgi:TnpA family transposase